MKLKLGRYKCAAETSSSLFLIELPITLNWIREKCEADSLSLWDIIDSQIYIKYIGCTLKGSKGSLSSLFFFLLLCLSLSLSCWCRYTSTFTTRKLDKANKKTVFDSKNRILMTTAASFLSVYLSINQCCKKKQFFQFQVIFLLAE